MSNFVAQVTVRVPVPGEADEHYLGQILVYADVQVGAGPPPGRGVLVARLGSVVACGVFLRSDPVAQVREVVVRVLVH